MDYWPRGTRLAKAAPMFRVLTTLLFCTAFGAVTHAAPLRLNAIAVSRFTTGASGEVSHERGLLDALGAFRVTDVSPVLVAVPVPPDAQNRLLIQLEAWLAYQRLGPEAVINFVADATAVPFMIGARPYIPIQVSADPKLSGGELINLSTRGRASATEKLIGGFVVDEQHRWVLVRAVGPGLAGFGVGDTMADPYLTLYKGRTPIYFNGDWSMRPDQAEIAAAAQRAGAFPLAAGSKDAALLVQLPPGSYTAQVEPESGSAGNVLLEVYRVPGLD